MSSSRIEFFGMGGICDLQETRVDRTLPAALKRHFPGRTWAKLCNSFDDVLRPMNRIKKYQRIFTCVCLTLFTLPFIGIPIGILGGQLEVVTDEPFDSSTSNTQMEEEEIAVFIDEDDAAMESGNAQVNNNSSSASGPLPLIFIVLFFCAFASFFILICSTCYFNAKYHDIMSHVQAVCVQASAQHPDLSFHLRNERTNPYGFRRRGLLRPFFQGYIEVSIGNVSNFVASPYGGGG